MSSTALSKKTIESAIAFHGHNCPGLAIGLRAAELALNEVGHAADEGVVTVVETDMCGVDGIQFLTGCTFGKGNLIHRDYGKMAFSFYNRKDRKAIRIVMRPEALGAPSEETSQLREKRNKGSMTESDEARSRDLRDEQIAKIMSMDLDDLFEIKEPTQPLPVKARLLPSLTCQNCGEGTMESRTRRLMGRTLCIPCFEAVERR